MKRAERIKMVKAMEYIARQVNNEEVFETWLVSGVADGDINYGDLDSGDDDGNLEIYYDDDEEFADLMDTFLFVMREAYKVGGLYCDSVVSKEREY